MDRKITAEQELFDAVTTAGEDTIAATLARIPRDDLEFTGRCYAGAITRGLAESSLLFARAGFRLNVMDELPEGASLRSFMQRYAHARIQRTYYLPIVQSPKSCAPIDALLQAGVGLTQHDRSELLSLAVRADAVPLARVLVEGGATLVPDIHQGIPADLVGKNALSRNRGTAPWTEVLSPQLAPETIGFVLEQLGESPAPIRKDWFKLYFRNPDFAEKLALIALRAAPETCEDTRSTLIYLARAGKTAALGHVLSWPTLDQAEVDAARDAAREAGQVEAVAALLAPRGKGSNGGGAGKGSGPANFGGLAPLEL